MNAACITPIHICRLRVTRLTSTGAVAAAPSNHYVTDSVVSLEIEPEVEEGEDKTLIGGCDCVCATYKGRNKLKRFNLTLTLCKLEPEFLELMLGYPLLTNGTSQAIGNAWPDQSSCSYAQNKVAIEAWADAWSGDAQFSTYPYVRFVFKSSQWQIDSHTLENEFLSPALVGFSESNANFGNAYVDYPTGVTSLGNLGGYFYDQTRPAAYCGYSTTST